MSERWDRHFLQLSLDHARMSKDPSTRVGSIIVGVDREIISAGFNGFPRGIADISRWPSGRAPDRETAFDPHIVAELASEGFVGLSQANYTIICDITEAGQAHLAKLKELQT